MYPLREIVNINRGTAIFFCFEVIILALQWFRHDRSYLAGQARAVREQLSRLGGSCFASLSCSCSCLCCFTFSCRHPVAVLSLNHMHAAVIAALGV